jgi:hypothetical protein
MERMDMYSRNEYFKVLRERYLKAKSKKEKSQILNEYCSNTGQSRKYVVRKIRRADLSLSLPNSPPRKLNTGSDQL